MKILDRVVIVFVTLCFFILAIGASVLPYAKSPGYYLRQYEKYDQYEKSKLESKNLDSDQLEKITERMIDYLFAKRDDMQYINEVTGEEVFSEDAINHMVDVRVLFTGGRIIVLVTFLVMLALIAYIILRFKHLKGKILSTSLYTLGGIGLAIVILFVIITVTYYGGGYSDYFEAAFIIFHKIIFPDPSKFDLAVTFPSNDSLIIILNARFFFNFAVTIGVTFGVIVVLGYSLLAFFHYRGSWLLKKLGFGRHEYSKA